MKAAAHRLEQALKATVEPRYFQDGLERWMDGGMDLEVPLNVHSQHDAYSQAVEICHLA